MAEKRIQFSNIVNNQLPAYVREEFPLVTEFLSQYYISQEFKSAGADLIQNIDQYIKIDENANTVNSVFLSEDIELFDDVITINLASSPAGTDGFPQTYGLLKIDDEIITYTNKTNNSFTGCVRGFSGVTSYNDSSLDGQLVFSESSASAHFAGAEIINLSDLFLKEFLKKTKYQLLPGFENRELAGEVNPALFIKQSKDFYSTRGTDESFKILFSALYGKSVKIIKPKEYLFRPSDSNYVVTNDLIVESVDGDPLDLLFSNLVQDEYGDILKGYGPIAKVEKIYSNSGEYYKLGIDSGYNRDIQYEGAVYGRFSVHQKTKVIGQVSAGSSVLDVDSTIGFSNSGELYVTYNDNTVGFVTYASKSINQFFECSNIEKTILDQSSVGINTYAYGYSFKDQSKIIKVRINSILSELKTEDGNYGFAANDPIVINTLGVEPSDVISNNWFFNIAVSYDVTNLTLLDTSNQIYSVTVKTSHNLIVGDSIKIIDASNNEINCNVNKITSNISFNIVGQGLLDTSKTYIIKRNISKGNSSNYQNISKINTNVQNVYKHGQENTLVSSSSIPTYYNQQLNPSNNTVIFSGTFIGDTFKITNTSDHGYYTGDAVYYTPEKNNVEVIVDETLQTTEQIITSLFDEGLYYVKRVDSNNIKLARSKSNINNQTFVTVDSASTVNNNKFEKYEYRNKNLDHQKLLRKISPALNNSKISPTLPGKTGILINGVEIVNYKANDTIYYGNIESIEVTSSGLNYDIINPPRVVISDSVGSGATGYCAVRGSLEEIRIVDPGFDYSEMPVINITGGNGFGAIAKANLKLVDHKSYFYADGRSAQVNLTSNSIGFSTYHKFRKGESVYYKPEGEVSVGGLSTDATYYASVSDLYTIKLHKTFDDSISGINTISFTSYGSGRQYLQSTIKKSIISSINVENSGSGYENKKRTVSSSGINTSTSIIEIKNHNYGSGEIVKYDASLTSIAGLSSGSSYYVTALDNDRFKLSTVGTGNTESTFYYKTKQYIEFTSGGSGTHYFNYPPISVEVIGTVGIASTTNNNFKAVVQPIFRGSVSSIHLESTGFNYGSEDIINYERLPNITLADGNTGQLTPVVNNGSIVEVLVYNRGKNYLASPTLTIIGEGSGAVLTPIIENGFITSVKVIEGGTGYVQGETFINVSTPGSGVELKANIKKWTINLFEKNISNIKDDDGFITESYNNEYGLQYVHLYAPRKLRESIFAIDQLGQKLYGKNDLLKRNKEEIASTDHSPIIGWAYDGNPIYGPYGYAKKSGGSSISQMKSGYSLSLKENRPPTSLFPEGFFVEDYSYFKSNDESVLDEYNGRFCVTPDFPDGTYAYFSTVSNSSADSSGSFIGYKRPVFPYFIGNNFKSSPIEFNFDKYSNQDNYDLNSTGWSRNTRPYNLINENASYFYINVPNDLNQKSIVKFASPGKVEKIGIITGGSNYRVNDSIVFDSTETSGFNANAAVSLVEGKQVNTISVATSSITGVEIYPDSVLGRYTAIANNPHNFNNGDIISVSGLNTTTTLLEGFYSVGINTSIFSLISGVSTSSITGIVTNFYIAGDLASIRENDILTIDSTLGSEQIKVLNVDIKKSSIRALRSINGIGVSHNATDIIRRNNRNLTVNSGFKTSFTSKVNKQIYFNPAESVGIGTTISTTTLFFDSVVDGSKIGIITGTKSVIYFIDSKDYQKYNKGGYIDIVDSTNVGFNTIATKIVSVGSTTINIDFNTSSLSGVGVTAYLNKRNAIEIQTKTIYIPNHGIETGDELTYSSNNGQSIGVSTNGIGITTLANNSNLYAVKISDDLIQLSPVKVALGSTGTYVGIASTTSQLGTLFFTGIGTGTYHSFATNYDVLIGNVSRSLVTVQTETNNQISANDTIIVDVNPSISTSFTVKYNDFNRRLVINPKDFSLVGVSTSNGTITIQNHGFEQGQKVIHTSTSPSGGLINDKIYYVVVIDENNIRLANSYYDALLSIPPTVGITSASFGTISAINPPIKIYKNSTITFNLSDSSLSYTNLSNRYSAFGFDIFTDSNFTNPFQTTKATNLFEVLKYGTVGITSDASLVLSVNESFPKTLYYNLFPVYDSTLPEEKSEIVVDEFTSNNQLQIDYSIYNGNHRVVSSSGTSFIYQVFSIPEKTSYSRYENSIIKYKTDSPFAYGSISDIKILNNGQNYFSLPGISSVLSGIGSGAQLEAYSNSIGNIVRTEIKNIGFDFPTDYTMRPTSILPQSVKIETLSSISSIGITSTGRGYTVAPGKLLLFDGKTNKLIPEVDFRYSLGDSKVTILKNTTSLYDVTPRILPTQNSNGVSVRNVGFNTITLDVTLTLDVGFSTSNSFPFKVSDKILVENISVGVGSTGKNYNSENYDWTLFTITSVDENLGGIGSVSYNLSEFINVGDYPGNFDEVNSSARVICERDFPVFDITLVKSDYFVDEIVSIGSVSGTVVNWDKKTNILKISARDRIEQGSVIIGQSSNVQGIASSVTDFDAEYQLNSISRFENGWSQSVGTFNNNLQVLQDGDYYQNFSYGVKSTIDYDTWSDIVGTLNHTAGFKKFAEYEIESNLDNESLMTVGVTSSVVEIISDNISAIKMNCYSDFDIVGENALKLGSVLGSDEILFENKILTDYLESVGNRVLSIDDISNQFNSNPRETNYSVVDRFPLESGRVQKYITYIRDKRYTGERQLMLVTLLQANSTAYLNQYGRVESVNDMGSFDYAIDGSDGVLLYYPSKYVINDFDITTLSYRLRDGLLGTGTTTIGNIATIETNSVAISGQTTIFNIGKTYRSAKILVEIDADGRNYEFDELNLIHDGTNVDLIEYGQLTSHSSVDSASSSGFGTYYPYISGSQLKIDFIPAVGVGTTININTIYVALADETTSGSGSTTLNHAIIQSNTTSIGASTSPSAVGIASYRSIEDSPDDIAYIGAYYLVQISDTTNGRHQLSEVITVDFDSTTTNITEFANIGTETNLGTIDAIVTNSHTQLTFTPIPNINVDVKVYWNAMRYEQSTSDYIDFTNAYIESQHGLYFGTESDIKREFNLTHNNYDIFRRVFDGSDSTIVDTFNNTITVPNHFFVSGEKVVYSNSGTGTTASIGISTTSIVGFGTTDKLPSTVYIVKINENTIKFAGSAEDSLKSVPSILDLTSVGIGASHSITAVNQNAKVLVSIDNLIQSPVVLSDVTTRLAIHLNASEDIAYFTGITSFFSGDLIKIDSEIMKIEGIGIGYTNAIRLRRPWMGTTVVGHSSDSLVTKVSGNYNIVDNHLNFSQAPYGKVPLTSGLNAPDEVDWVGISTGSSFGGRVFMRSGVINSANETYSKNYIFDDISEQFNTTKSNFRLKSGLNDVTGISTENAIVLINDIFQGPGIFDNYTLSENAGITTLNFVGTARTISDDVGISSFPKGGLIISVGSTEGFGYQPLISAGGTATVSVAGTISTISIGNSGSGYRGGVQIVKVGVQTESTTTAKIEFIGTATVSGGRIVGVSITNPGLGYTSTNPPIVVFDDPLSYSDIPLIYSSSSTSGIGTRATIDIVVGQGSNIIDFEIKNTGYAYQIGNTLTVPVGGLSGIPTTSSFGSNEFQITIQRTFNDKFSGWSIGELQVLDSIEELFDGQRLAFQTKVNDDLVSIRSGKGSNINVEDNLLVFVNNILQVPGEGYLFPGGSTITFTEAPKSGDTARILFYKGSGSIDVIERNIMETVKVGDDLIIGYDSTIGQEITLQETSRGVSTISSTELVKTVPYFGPGNVDDITLRRPVTWCKQTEDKIINGQEVSKDRILYEPVINSSAYLIQSVGIGSTIVYVDNIRPFFNQINESFINLDFQKNITFISQDSKIAAAATAIVSIAGTVSSIIVNNGGVGYSTNPEVVIQNPIGLGTTQRATASSTIVNGTVTNISVTMPGTGYTSSNPPLVLIESPEFEFSTESISVNNYEGDNGIIVGVSTASVSGATTAIVFDFYIPQNSYLRNPTISGVTTVSGIQTGYYFTVFNTNIGYGMTSLNNSGNIVGVGTNNLDNVYQAISVSIAQTSAPGIGITYVSRVTASLSNYNNISGIGYSSHYGEFSWGRINLPVRIKENSYNSYTLNGFAGISTGTLVKRTNSLKYFNYTP